MVSDAEMTNRAWLLMLELSDGRDLPVAAADWHAGSHPTFAEMRGEAYRLLVDARDVLCSDWRAAANPTDDEVTALFDAEDAVHAALTALRRAGADR